MNLYHRLIQGLFQKVIKRFAITTYPYKPFMHRYRCVFIHIPKTAGSSFLSLFNDSGARWHLSWLHYFRANQRCFKQYYKFTVVREPVARLFSAYNYCLLGGNQSTLDLALQQVIKDNSVDFNSFIINLLSADFILQQELFLPQYLYIFDRQLTCKVDKILRYEQLAIEWPAIAVKYNFPSQLPVVNATNSLAQSQKLSPFDTINETALTKVRQLYQKDFELLNYPINECKL